MKAPLPPDESLRLQTLREYHILDTLPEEVYDDLAGLAGIICGCPVSLMTLIDDDRQWFKSRVGVDMEQTPREIAFCAHTILQEHVMQVPDMAADARFADNPLVTDGPRVRFYAGAPLVTADGAALGTLCVLDTKPHELSAEQVEALRILARQVVVNLELRRTIGDLAQLVASQDLLELAGGTPADAEV